MWEKRGGAGMEEEGRRWNEGKGRWFERTGGSSEEERGSI